MARDLPAQNQKGESSSLAQQEAIPRATSDTSSFVTRRGLLLPKQMSFDKWMGIGSYLSSIYSSSAWCLGDWLAYGETTFNGKYRDAIKLTSLDYQTLRNHAWVARRFPMSRRRDTLSFTHHAEVAALAEPEQDFWLRKAEEYGWSAKRLRREVKASLLERTTDDDQEPGESRAAEDAVALPAKDDAVALPAGDTVSLKVSISADRLESCHAAASRLGLKVEAWAGQILAEAAEQAPDNSTFAGLVDHAAVSSQASRMASISAGVGWSGRAGRYLAAIRTRLSLAIMSEVDGWVLVVYQGSRARRSARSAGWCPAVAYQIIVSVWQASAKGTVRRTAAAVRLRACPAPKIDFESSNATSIDHLAAYRSMICAGVAVGSVLTSARS
jgi:hypothetical protein